MSLYNDNMSSLNSAQLVLLNILVTFVVSIATTIISIALLADTPLSITQVVNNVNEYQRERIVDAELDSIREDLLASVQAAIPVPQVAGVSEKKAAATIAGFDDQILAITKDGYLVLSDLLRVATTTKEGGYGSIYGEGGVYEIAYKDLVFLHAKDFEGFAFPAQSSLGQDVIVYGTKERRLVRSYVSQADTFVVSGAILSLQVVPGCFSGGFVFLDGALAGICVTSERAVTGIDLIRQNNTIDNEKEKISTN